MNADMGESDFLSAVLNVEPDGDDAARRDGSRRTRPEPNGLELTYLFHRNSTSGVYNPSQIWMTTPVIVQFAVLVIRKPTSQWSIRRTGAAVSVLIGTLSLCAEPAHAGQPIQPSAAAPTQ